MVVGGVLITKALTADAQIKGKVFLEGANMDGGSWMKPLEADVSVQRLDKIATAFTIHTESDGTFVLSLRPGKYEIQVDTDTKTLTVKAGQTYLLEFVLYIP